MLVFHFKDIILREYPSMQPCYTNSQGISMRFLLACQTANNPDRIYCLRLIIGCLVALFNIPCWSICHNKLRTLSQSIPIPLAAVMLFTTPMLKLGNLLKSSGTIISKSQSLIAVHYSSYWENPCSLSLLLTDLFW